MKHVIIVGGGFAGLNAAKKLGNKEEIKVTLIDKSNHHLFQPLLYQVAMAALSPADIAVPIRSLLSKYRNVNVINGIVVDINVKEQKVYTKERVFEYDYLIMACGAKHAYFGNEQWEEFAPGLKTLEQATEIRRRVLNAFERAEKEENKQKQKKLMTFVIVGAGPTGVELAGAIGEMSRYTLAKDFRNIDPKLTRIILIEGGERILPSFDAKLAFRATRDLEMLGVQIWTSSFVTNITAEGVEVGNEKVEAATVVWAAGVKGSELSSKLGAEVDRVGRVMVEKDLSINNYKNVFVVGDQANFIHFNGKPLPGQAPIALQQGKYIAGLIVEDIEGKERKPFQYFDKGQMATIGRSRAICEAMGLRLTGFLAWAAWLLIHIYYLTGFKNRVFVVASWAWSYLSFKRGARLIVPKEWRFYKDE